jgi:hypothetical protein
MKIHVDSAHRKLVAQRKKQIVVEKIIVETNHS